MYVYTRKTRRKAYTVALLSVGIVVCSILSMFLSFENKEVIPVTSEEEVVNLPNEDKKVFILPFKVEANIVKEYFDGSDHEVLDYTKFEGVYRVNQGIDYSYNDESFDVINMYEGEVVEVKEDPIFGNSITIQSENVKITYQSLDAINLKEKTKIRQGDVIGKAAKNTYNPELGNHLHLVVTVDDKLVNPKTIIDKEINEIVLN